MFAQRGVITQALRYFWLFSVPLFPLIAMVWYRNPIFVCIVACIIPNLGGFLGSLITNTSEDSWYGGLFKPKYNPPSWVNIRYFIYIFLNFKGL